MLLTLISQEIFYCKEVKGMIADETKRLKPNRIELKYKLQNIKEGFPFSEALLLNQKNNNEEENYSCVFYITYNDRQCL